MAEDVKLDPSLALGVDLAQDGRLTITIDGGRAALDDGLSPGGGAPPSFSTSAWRTDDLYSDLPDDEELEAWDTLSMHGPGSNSVVATSSAGGTAASPEVAPRRRQHNQPPDDAPPPYEEFESTASPSEHRPSSSAALAIPQLPPSRASTTDASSFPGSSSGASARRSRSGTVTTAASSTEKPPSAARLCIAVLAVGPRAEVAPFAALARQLGALGHRVRVATHGEHAELVRGGPGNQAPGVRFVDLCVGSDEGPWGNMLGDRGATKAAAEECGNGAGSASAAGGIVASWGESEERNDALRVCLEVCWEACAGFDEGEEGHEAGQGLLAGKGAAVAPAVLGRPFVADLVIANPLCMAGLSVAEKLGVPLRIMSTVPWTPTREFPHPLARVRAASSGAGVANLVSYTVVETRLWNEYGRTVNHFRRQTLQLSSLDTLLAPTLAHRLCVPTTYFCSAALLRRPKDWGAHVSLGGYLVDDDDDDAAATDDDAVDAYLHASPEKPVLVDLTGATDLAGLSDVAHKISRALDFAGCRAIVSLPPGGFALAAGLFPPDALVVESLPAIDGLVAAASCVVQPGRAGTLHRAVARQTPTILIPAFGQQFFWAKLAAAAAAVHGVVPLANLQLKTLAAKLAAAKEGAVTERQAALGVLVERESRPDRVANLVVKDALESHAACALAADRVACWTVKKSAAPPISTVGVAALLRAALVKPKGLEPFRPCDFEDQGPMEPLTGVALATYNTVSEVLSGATAAPREMLRQASIAESSSAAGSASSSAASPSAARDAFLRRSSTATSSSSGGGGSGGGSGGLSSNAVAAVAINATAGVGRIIGAGLKAPATITHGLAKGFHNAPRLYGDETVRSQQRVTGVKSGFAQAGKVCGPCPSSFCLTSHGEAHVQTERC